jgi:hypothetical protein
MLKFNIKSNSNILVPNISAIMALVINMPDKIKNILLRLFCSVVEKVFIKLLF